MATTSQRKASTTHRRRAAARGLVRVEVQAAKADTGLIRALAETLRGEPERAKRLRSTLEQALIETIEEEEIKEIRQRRTMFQERKLAETIESKLMNID